MIVNHNIPADNAVRMSGLQQKAVAKTMSRVSSGDRIVSPGDDASGLALSEKMRAQIGGLKMASRNAQDARSFIQSTEGYLRETQSILVRVRDLSIQSGNGLYSTEDRMQTQVEVSQLMAEISRVASHARYNGVNILTGRFAFEGGVETMRFHVGPDADQAIKLNIGEMTLKGLGLTDDSSTSLISISSSEKSNRSLGVIDGAIQKVVKQRADLGAYQVRLNYLTESLDITSENLQSSESLIRDADIAEESVKLAKEEILSQMSFAMLAQANMRKQSVLRLLS